VRRLLLVVSLVVLVDTMLFAALGPLLPEYSDTFGLSKTGAGLLVGVYAVGVLMGALPAGLASARFGRRATTVAGLVLMGVASVGFAFAGDEWTLGLSRLVQGFGSALSWSGGLAWLVALTPGERRG
jgi:MFS family permease